jgi:hypothetical protein
VLRQTFVDERVVGGEQIDHAAILADDAVKEQFRLATHSSPAGNSPSTRIVATCFSFGTRTVYFSRAPSADSVGAILMCARNREAQVNAKAEAPEDSIDAEAENGDIFVLFAAGSLLDQIIRSFQLSHQLQDEVL